MATPAQPPPPFAEQLAAEAPWLRLLLAHLAGRSLLARMELEDLVQEVFLRALSRPEWCAAAQNANLRPPLALLAREVVIDAARAARAAKRGGGHEGLRLGSDALSASNLRASVTGPLTAVMRGERNQALLASFLSLSPEHRRVIGLRQLEQKSARETAERMGRSEVAVHSIYRRALQAWAEALGQDPQL